MKNSPVYYVFDANVFISAMLMEDSVPGRAFVVACATGQLLLSQAVINELDDVLRRPRLEKYLHEKERIHFLTSVVHEACVIKPSETVTDCRDPKDNKYLELALTGHASCIISGDKDLLVLNPYRGIPVLTPRQFLDQFGDAGARSL